MAFFDASWQPPYNEYLYDTRFVVTYRKIL